MNGSVRILTWRTKPMTMLRPLAFSFLLLPAFSFAQDRLATRTGEVTFFSETPMENIEAVNHKATAVLDLASGAIQTSMLIKAFEFEKALMQEHFNENYMESGTWPKAEFKGKIVGFTAADAQKTGKYEVTLEGDLEVHGVKKPRTLKGTIEVTAPGSANAICEFIVKPADHGIKVPGGVNVADEIKVTARLDLRKM